MMRQTTFYFLLILITMTVSCNVENVDLIVRNANIYTVDELNNKAEAMAIKNGKIVAIGPENEILNKFYSENVLDAHKNTIIPGFNDAHAHLLGYAKGFLEVNLVGTYSFEQVLQRCKKFQATNQHRWLLGRGWDQNDWEEKNFPDNTELNKLFPDTPVLLTRIDGHAAIANDKALKLAGFTESTEIYGGKLLKNDAGKLTGVLIDKAVDSIRKFIPPYDDELLKNAFIKAQNTLLALGITTVQDAGIDLTDLDFLMRLETEGILKLKLYEMYGVSPDNIAELANFKPITTKYIKMQAVKLYADGALGSRGACLLQPYTDQPKETGFLLYPVSFFEQVAKMCYKNNLQLCTHCIGDSANRVILDIYGKYLETTNDKRWRIEHAQIVHPDDLNKFNTFTIIPSVQPTHATSDMPWAEQRLGEDRLNEAYAYQSLLKQNGMIALGTDFPVELPNPLNTFYAAVFRKNTTGMPKNGFMPNEALSRQATLKGMTVWNALAMFSENEIGSLEPGKYADFILLDNDILTCNESQILTTKVLYTFVNGEKVYEHQ